MNAIEYAAELVLFLRGIGEELAAGPQDPDYDVTHSTLSVGLIQGGSAINIVPNTCQVTFEFRNLAEVDQEGVFRRIEGFALREMLPRMQARHPGALIRFERIYEYPAHAIAAGDPLVTRMKHLVGRNDHSKVAFGTEAGLFLRELGLPTIVCGPGAIAVAHKPDEYVERTQLAACDEFMRKLVTS
ncbi:Acetylornithine deacetylase [Rubellimicrobium mesophilum DSM 19309]|uniref:Acetylornithine deacetylase n=1 Tax=Rubellimicrobium mesophilum DSM 19309 TaxID=442562 RepID=A0A017HQ18_9RHOB|nr:Acetylornithine deacetylase [Rubellimicrobium mesophilum DSM 19309]